MSTPVKLVLNICDDFSLRAQIKNKRVYIFESPLNQVECFFMRREMVPRFLPRGRTDCTGRATTDDRSHCARAARRRRSTFRVQVFFVRARAATTLVAGDSGFATGMEFACILCAAGEGRVAVDNRVPVQPAVCPDLAGSSNDVMTTTDIGILLIVLCVLLWAIMAALHRHTLQLKALQAQLEELLAASRPKRSHSTEADVLGRNDHGESRTAHVQGEKRA